MVNAITADFGSAVSAPTEPTKTGCTFDGWYSDIGMKTPYVFATMPAEDITLNGKWTINEYTISFDSNGGSSVSQMIEDYGTVISAPTAPTKTGYSFVGWYSDIGLATPYVFTMMPAENLMLYAKWAINEYTITFETDGGSSVAPITADFNSIVTAPLDPTKEFYIFEGWYADAEFTTEYLFTNMPAANITVYAKWTFDQYFTVLSVADFKALDPEDSEHHFVSGVVLIGGVDINLIVIADPTGMLIVFSNEPVGIGDFIRVGGYRMAEGDFVILGGTEEDPIDVDIFAHGQPIPITPVPMTIGAFNDLDGIDSANWGLYAELGGVVTVDPNTHMVTLVDGENVAPIIAFDEPSHQLLARYEGFQVKMRGLILPNMDEEIPFLMFIFNGHPDFITFDYEDAVLLGMLEEMFRDYFEAPSYFPGQYIDLPSKHPVLPISVSYELFGPNASLFDLETNQVSSDIESELDIDIHVTVTITGGTSSTFDIKLHVDPDLFTDIAVVRAQPDSEVDTYIIRGVVIMTQPMDEDVLLMVADETGIIYVNTNDHSIVIGDGVIAIGFKMSMGNIMFLFNEPSKTINQVYIHDQTLPLVPLAISLADFAALTPEDVGSSFVYYEITGTINYMNPSEPDSSMFYVTDSVNNVYVYPVDAAARAALAPYAGTIVTVQGIAFVGGDPGSEFVIFAYIAFPGTILVS